MSVAAGVLATAAGIAAEEKLLVRTYPEYSEYSRMTACAVPFVLWQMAARLSWPRAYFGYILSES
jgi:hypothetical protein